MAGVPNDRVERALELLLSWPPIARSPQLASFLSYIVNSKLKGEEAQIKAYSIAVDVFGRPPSFDPQNDPIVRVQARRLRALLEQFYDEGNGDEAGIRIDLPVGGYVPEFVELSPGPAAAPPTEAAKDEVVPTKPRQPAAEQRLPKVPTWLLRTIAGVVAVVLIGVGVLIAGNLMSPPVERAPDEPKVLIGKFSNLSGMSDLDPMGLQLTVTVEQNLKQFEEMRVLFDDTGRPASQPLALGSYLLSGIIHAAGPGIEVTVSLIGAAGDSVWNATYAFPLPGADAQAGVVETVAKNIARDLGPFRGPVHARGRAWLDEQPRPLPAVSSYICLLAYDLAREVGSSSTIVDALTCVERLLSDRPDSALALSSEAWLEMRAALNATQPLRRVRETIDTSEAKALRALEMMPNSSLVHEHLGAIRTWQDRFDASEKDFAAALQLNPFNTDARAGYAIALGRSMKWALGGEQASLAVSDTPYPSPWYYYPLALSALRDGQFEEALEAGRIASKYGGGEAGTLIALVAAQALGRQDTMDELRSRLLSLESFRRSGVMPWLAAQVSDPAMLAQVAVALGRAGVPSDALTGPF